MLDMEEGYAFVRRSLYARHGLCEIRSLTVSLAAKILAVLWHNKVGPHDWYSNQSHWRDKAALHKMLACNSVQKLRSVGSHQSADALEHADMLIDKMVVNGLLKKFEVYPAGTDIARPKPPSIFVALSGALIQPITREVSSNDNPPIPRACASA